MMLIHNLVQYADETGGVFTQDDIQAIPYNHWKRDCEWIVLVVQDVSMGAFIPVSALTANEACLLAVSQYKITKDLYD